jgi:ribosome-associated protein
MTADELPVPATDLQIDFVRSAGPGGQNVNKLATAAQLRFDLAGNRSLAEDVKSRLRGLAGRRLTDEGSILIIARNHRTQEGNRREALQRLQGLIEAASVAPRPRKATKPTRASQQRRLQGKARDARTKQMRARVRNGGD